MRTVLVLACLVALSSGSALATAPDGRVPVDVRLVGDDGLTLKFAAALVGRLAKHPTLRPATYKQEAVLVIESDSNVDHDVLGGRKVVLYSVYVHRGRDRGDPQIGVCFETRVDKCAKDILRLAASEANPL